MTDHKHEIGDIYSLARILEEKEDKGHKHDEYAMKEHSHEGVGFTPSLYSGESISIDNGLSGQVFCTNTSERPVHIKDYFVSKLPKRFNCQNIIIPHGKQFAVRIYKAANTNFILFDGMINEL